ncbi:hrq1, partial [Symbiodinium microadriaticum]
MWSMCGEGMSGPVEYLLSHKQLVRRGDSLHLHPGAHDPFKAANLRVIDSASFQVLDISGADPVLLGSVEYSRAFYELFEGAVYLHQGKQYLVTVLNLTGMYAHCKPTSVGYYTSASDHMDLEVVKQLQGGTLVGFGSVNVKLSVWGYNKVWLKDGRLEWGGNCSLPCTEFDTSGFWVNIPVALQHFLRCAGADMVGSIHAANHALVAAASLFVQCDGGDLNTAHNAEGYM